MAAPEERLQGEYARWYQRFLVYLHLGPVHRSLYAAWKKEQGEAGQQQRKRSGVPGSWRGAAKRYQWETRAERWDEHNQDLAKKAVVESMRKIRAAAVEAAEVLINLMGHEEPEQQRLAANSVLNRAGVVHDTTVTDDGVVPIEIVEII